MQTESAAGNGKYLKKFSTLKILLTVYGLLYIIFLTDFNMTENIASAQGVVVNLAFVLFLAGYYIVWRHEGIAGIVFIFWYSVMWILALFIAKDGGGAVAMGFPLFILAILLMISWWKKKSKPETTR
jgi:hypothetical protein